MTDAENYAKYQKYKNKYIQLKRQQKEKHYVTDQGIYIYYNEINFEDLSPSDITFDPTKNAKDKVLVINDVSAFDQFTKLYCDANFEQRYVFIKWDKVMCNYRGFYLNQDNALLKLMAYDMYNYKDRHMFTSWWSKEYANITSKVIIFNK
jgi:hypothetical protein